MLLTVIIVSWNTCQLLDECLISLKREIEESDIEASKVEVFVIDNASADSSPDMVAADHPWVRLIRNKTNRGFAAANNQALWLARGQYVFLLNPDTKLTSGCIKSLITFLAEHPQAGVVAPQLLNGDGSIQRSCRAFPSFLGMFFELLGLSRLFPHVAKFREYKMLDWDHTSERQVDQPEGACLMIKKEVFKEVGLFDETFFMLFEEVDWCYRVKEAGWQIWFTPCAKVIHYYGQSIKQVKIPMILSSHRGLYRFWFKHYRKDRQYLDGIAYSALMLLAYLRIAVYQLKSTLRLRQIGVQPATRAMHAEEATRWSCVGAMPCIARMRSRVCDEAASVAGAPTLERIEQRQSNGD